jgi:hypothetical protein
MPKHAPPVLDNGSLGVWATLDAASKGPPTAPVSARFVDEAERERGVSVLEIARSGPLERGALDQALFHLRIQVVGWPAGMASWKRSGRHGKRQVERVQVVDFDGGPIGRRRRPGLCADLVAILSGPWASTAL